LPTLASDQRLCGPLFAPLSVKTEALDNGADVRPISLPEASKIE
jgi:hypothetical protein